MLKAIRVGMFALVLMAGEAAAQFCPGLPPWVFDDVPSTHPFCTDITWMAERSVTLGCSAIDPNHRLYCPDRELTRAEMAAFMHRLGDALFPLTCAAGQVMKWNGLAWACASDNIGGAGGGGTVTSVAAGIGLSSVPNPIVGAGTISLATTYRLPQACAANQIPKWNGAAWTCAADASAGGTVTSLTAGSGITLTPNPILAAGTIAADTAYLQRRVSACAAGTSIRLVNPDGSVVCQAVPTNAFVQGGNMFFATAVLGTTDDRPLDVRVNGSRVMRYEPDAISPNLIGGNPANNVTAGVRGATIGGGGIGAGDSDPDYFGDVGPNRITDNYGTVGGGLYNQAGDAFGVTFNAPFATVGGGVENIASGSRATIGGGQGNVASDSLATVSGGGSNVASGFAATVGGGVLNVASGFRAAIPGGSFNEAEGDFSFAAGRRAKALGNGSFSFADSNDFDFSSNLSNAFQVRATGGVRFVTDINDVTGVSTWSCLAVAGAGWACASDRNQKQNLQQLDGQAVLQRLVTMPVFAWNPKGRNAHVHHYGPMAQDFHAAFGLGDDDTMIGSQDADGVALAAIQGLNAKLDTQLKARDVLIEEQRSELAAQQAQINELRSAIGVLLARLALAQQLAQAR